MEYIAQNTRIFRLTYIAALVQDEDVAAGYISHWTCKERDPTRDLIGLHGVPMGHLCDGLGQNVFAQHTKQRRFRHCRRYRIHTNFVSRISAREIFGQCIKCRFAGAVGGGIEDVEIISSVRGDVDDLFHATAC